MRCNLTKMRVAGVAIPKYDLREAAKYRDEGDLLILDTRENNLNRIVKRAQFTRYKGRRDVDLLFEPHVLWMSENKFVLTGFEQCLLNGKLPDFAQSWPCKVVTEPDPENPQIDARRSKAMSR
jgi:hypothetical protein